MSTAPSAPVDPLTGMSTARFGVYVHFPYCLSKCPYCDFASTVAKEIPGEKYAQAILAELKLRLAEGVWEKRPVESIFIGGGTPSLWEPIWVHAVLEAIRENLGFAEGAEISLEANPGASDQARFSDLRKAGINRLSIGVQSFNIKTLKALGREHDGAAALRAYDCAREAGFENVSMDFIYGVQGQELEEAAADARKAASLGPEHLSAYALTLDREVLAEEVPLSKKLVKGEIHLPPDDTVVAMSRAIREIYAQHGLFQYEISNYAKRGFHSRHNCLYWTGGEYLALGVGAAGYFHAGQGGARYSNLRSPEAYWRALTRGSLPEAGREVLGRRERFLERLAMGLRLRSGVDLAEVCRQFQEPWQARSKTADRLIRDGFAEHRESKFSLTSRGGELHSAICAQLF